MADWLYIGYCTVMAMFAVAAAYAAGFGLRALRRLPRSLLLGFAAAATVATLTAQKTNNVPPNMNQPQMQPGGGSFQTGFTELTGLPLPVTHSPFPDDIMRGWRVESVTTNAAVSYAMPTNATLVGNWHIHGASSSFGNNRIDFGNWAFPLGTNDEVFSSFWYFIDGRIRPAPHDVVHEISAVGVPMSAVPGESRLWRLDDDGARILTWENFFLGGDTNSPVNAQIVLSPNGDFLTRSNDVETVCRRINPGDWDDDGIPNDEDANPTVCDGDFFGPANILPAGANTNAYCTISVVATGPDALVTFAGDKPCNYPDPHFVAKSGVTNEVVILIGKTYAISSDWPFAVVGVSDPETEVWQMRGAGHQTYVCRPVTISASDGNPFTMSVVPLYLGGVFLWPSAQCSCSINGSGDTFTWNCPMNCTCCGCNVEGQYSYEGYWLPATSCLCGCYYDGTGPKWEPSPAPLAASVSASFSKSAVIFEDAYEDEPGRWVGKNSTRTRLNIVANGGPNGGTLSVTSANIGKLSRISGPDLPLAPVAVPAETQVSYAIVYEGATASAVASDIAVRATMTENLTGDIVSNECNSTSVKIELEADQMAIQGGCTNRHVFGVDEKVNTHVWPVNTIIEWRDEVDIDVCLDGRSFYCPWTGGLYSPVIECDMVQFSTSITVVEPQVVCSAAEWDGVVGTNGVAGNIRMNLHLCIEPRYVSFEGLYMEEIPDNVEREHSGYFNDPIKGGAWSHTEAAGAGVWEPVRGQGYWTTDHPKVSEYVPPWTKGSKVWCIPVGWGQPGVLKGRIMPDPTTQRFEITEAGVVTIEKYQHVIMRDTANGVWLDGEREN